MAEMHNTKSLSIQNDEKCLVETKMLAACMAKAAQYLTEQSCIGVDLFVTARVPMDAPSYRHPGWLEYVMVVKFDGNSNLEMHCVQRKPHLDVEFHT